jgi:hypothetical protein
MLLSISANSRILMTGATEIRGWMAETSGVHVSGATSLWLQTTVSVTLGETVKLQCSFRTAEGYFAADQTSFYRSPDDNRAMGGATRSKHLDGAAFDIAMSNHDPVAFEAAARAVGFLWFGFYPRSGFMHVDLGPARQWGERFPIRATAFAEETQPAREVLTDSRTMKGGGAVGVATLGAAGIELAQNVLSETQSAVLPPVPYLDTLRWVFIAAALVGVAVTIYARLDDWKRGRR